MPTIKKICLVCQRSFFTRRNPTQRYCSQPVCQRVRKNQWRQQKRGQDADYRENQRKANRRWQEKHADYWQHYRSTHSDYRQRNREQQRQRDKNRRGFIGVESKDNDLAKSDALTQDLSVLSGTYDLIAVTDPLLAKSDTLRVKITLISNDYIN